MEGNVSKNKRCIDDTNLLGICLLFVAIVGSGINIVIDVMIGDGGRNSPVGFVFGSHIISITFLHDPVRFPVFITFEHFRKQLS